MGRLANSWRTVKESWGVLKKDKELMLFPVLSGIASLIIIATFVIPTAFTGLLGEAVAEDGDPAAQTTVALVYLAMYLLLSFVTVYFNAALIFAASERLKGGDPTLRSGMRGANTRLGAIFAWAMFAGTVNLLLQLLQSMARSRGNFIGQILVSLVGVAWNLAIYFAVPVIIFEKKGVFASFKRSGQLFRQRWGESLVGMYGIRFAFGLIGGAVFFATILLAFLLFGVHPLLGVAALVGGIVAFLLVTIVGMTLGDIYKAALYHYAAWGQVPPGYSPDVIQNAYRTQPGHI